MEIPIYSFEGTMELYEWFQWLEEYFDYANIQNERDKTLTAALHLTEELEFEEKWNYKERKALELEYYNNIEEESWGVEDYDFELETINVEFKVDKYMEEKMDKEEPVKINKVTIPINTIELDLEIGDKQDVVLDANRNALEFLQQLEYLNLSTGHITGSIPTEIFNLKNLRELDLSQASYRQYSSFVVDNMNSLACPDFSVNNLTGDFTRELGFILETLKYFKFSYNNMTICWSNELVGRFPMAFRGVSSSYPIVANPHFLRDRGHRSSRLALALGIGLDCLLAGLVGLTVHVGRSKRKSYKSTKLVLNDSFPFKKRIEEALV
eukprot:Gb_32542 [translate_table: standard]